MADDAVRRALARLARRETPPQEDVGMAGPTDRPRTFRETIERATTATGDLAEAAAFLEAVGLDELEDAVARADQSVSACADDGRQALAAFRAFREAAEGDYFHPGHGTSLGGGDIAQSK